MARSVELEDLRQHIEEYVDEVANGTTIHVTRQGVTIATLRPPAQERASLIEPTKSLHDFTPGPLTKNLTVDPAQIIIEERERERNGSKY